MRQKYFLLGLVLVLGLILRLVSLSAYPAGFSADEANQGYTAYSILKTGRDEWGKFLPLAPRAYGDYRAPLYTYLTIPSVALLGLSEFSTRLPNSIIGTLAIFVIYLLVKELFKGQKIANMTAIFSAFMLAISPWHVSMSRGAFETNLPSFLFPLGVLLFIGGVKNPKMMALSALSFGLSSFSYYSARTLVPVVAIILYATYLRAYGMSVFKIVSKYRLAFCISAFFGVVVVSTMLMGSSTRVLDVALFSSESSFKAAADSKYEAVLLGLPDIGARIFSNKAVFVGEQFLRNYLGYFSLNFLFIEGAGEATYGMVPGLGPLYLIELPFLVYSLYLIFCRRLYKKPEFQVLLALVLCSPIPAALTTSHGFAANRAAIMLPWLYILAAFGASSILDEFRFKYTKHLILAAYSISLLFFVEKYFFHAPMQNARSMSYGWKSAASYLSEVSSEYSSVIVSRSLSEPQMFLSFYLRLDPSIVQEESYDWLRYQSEGLKFVDQLGEYRLQNYTIRSIDKNSDILLSDTLLLGKPEDFSHGTIPYKTINYPDGTPAMYLVATKGF